MTSSMRRKAYSDGKTDRLGDLSRSARVRPIAVPRALLAAFVVIALVAYNGSVLAEVIRAGVESLPRGQSEAGYAIGLRKSGVMAFVLLPQAIRSLMAQEKQMLHCAALAFLLRSL